MKIIWTGMLAALACFAAQAWGAEPNELTAGQSIRINAPPEVVWAVVGDYNGSPRWLPLVERSEIVVGKNNQVGAIRLITRRNGTNAKNGNDRSRNGKLRNPLSESMLNGCTN